MTTRLRARLLLGLLVLGLILLGLAWWPLGAPAPSPGVWTFVLLGLSAAAGELLPLPRPQGRSAPISMAVYATGALLWIPPLELVVAASLAWSVKAVVTVFRGDDLRRFEIGTRLLSVWSLAGTAAIGAALLPAPFPSDLPISEGGIPLGAILGVAIGVVVLLPALEAGEIAAALPRRTTGRIRSFLTSSWMATAALAASGVLGALIHPLFGPIAVPLVILPLLAARRGLRRYAEIARTYDQTLIALSKLPEHIDAVPEGHSERVRARTVAAGQRLGLDSETLEALTHAARLHEVGRIQFDEGQEVAPAAVAQAGASILRAAGSMEMAAELVSRHDQPAVGTRVNGTRDEHMIAARLLALGCQLDLGALDDVPIAEIRRDPLLAAVVNEG